MSSNVESVSEGSLQKNSHKNCDEEYNTIQYNKIQFILSVFP